MTVTAVILAGGASSRFGGDKALALFEGRPLIAHVADVLSAGASRLAVNAPMNSAAASWARAGGFSVLPDDPGHPPGALAGVHAALAWGASLAAEFVATSPCDTPRLPPDLLGRLCVAVGDRPGAVAQDAEGVVQPLCAVWRPNLLPILTAKLAQPRLPAMRRLVSDLRFAPVRLEEPSALANINTRADLDLLACGR